MVNNLIVCGGTFDHFHKGHESLLRLAFSFGGKVIVGVTSDAYIRSSKFKIPASPRGEQSLTSVELFEERKQAVANFLKNEGLSDKAEVISIDDLFGPTLSKDLLIDAIVVSDDTRKGAEVINQKRNELGLNLLKVIVAPSIASGDGRIISSERIRNGEIDQNGNLYVKPIWFEKDLLLPENLRQELQKPFGELLLVNTGLSVGSSLTITVGDVTAKLFNERGLNHELSVIDFKVEREQKYFNITELGFSGDENIVVVDNPAGSISKNLFKELSKIFEKKIGKTILRINGEEDLAVLPLILLAPLNTVIYYGQPHEGLVKIKVTPEAKNAAYNLVSKLNLA